MRQPPVKQAMYLARYLILNILISWSVVGVSGDAFKEGGEAYKRGDYETAAAKFKEVAAAGDHRAMYALGSMYAAGNGLPRDYKKALEWFGKAAGYGRPDAQYKLGLMYDEGIGVETNYRRAIRLYDAAAKNGYAHAQYRMGLMYMRGNGVKQDNIKAYAWLKAAQSNFASASATQPAGEAALPAEEPPPSGDPFANIHAGLIQSTLQDLTAVMTPEELQAAQDLARNYLQYR